MSFNEPMDSESGADDHESNSGIFALLKKEGFNYDSDDFDDIDDYFQEGGARPTEPISEPPSKSIRPLRQRAAALQKARASLGDPEQYLKEHDAKFKGYTKTLKSLDDGLERLRKRAEQKSRSADDSGEPRADQTRPSEARAVSRSDKRSPDDDEVEEESRRRSRNSPSPAPFSVPSPTLPFQPSPTLPSPTLPSPTLPIQRGRGRGRGLATRSRGNMRSLSRNSSLSGIPAPDPLVPIPEVNTPAHQRIGRLPSFAPPSPRTVNPQMRTMSFGSFGNADFQAGLDAQGLSAPFQQPPQLGALDTHAVEFSERLWRDPADPFTDAPEDQEMPDAPPAPLPDKGKGKGKARSKSPRKADVASDGKTAGTKFTSLFAWRPEENRWSPISELHLETSNYMTEYVENMRMDGTSNTTTLYRNAVADPSKRIDEADDKHACMGCRTITKSAKNCPNSAASRISCAICSNQRRPCFMVIVDPEYEETHYALGFLPLPEDERVEAEWEHAAFWYKQEKKQRAVRKPKEAESTAAAGRPKRTPSPVKKV